MAVPTRDHSHRSRGQALTETALILPVLLLLVLGGYDASLMGSNQLMAISSARHGARLASELGGIGTSHSSTPQCFGTVATGSLDSVVDNPVLQDVLGVAFEAKDTNNGNRHVSGLDYADVSEIVIYRASRADGKFNQGVDHANVYNITSQVVGGITQGKATNAMYSPAFPLSQRCQGPLGSETDIGVQMTYTYHPVNHVTDGLGLNLQFKDYSVEKEALCDDNCTPGP